MFEPEVDFDRSAVNVTTICESAAEFGLTPDQIWQAAAATLDRLPEETKLDCVDELSTALATRLLEKERER